LTRYIFLQIDCYTISSYVEKGRSY